MKSKKAGNTGKPLVSERKRSYELDLLRCAAAFAVVMLHTAAQKIYDFPPGSAEWIIFNIYDSLTVCAVPLFFMISGALFLSQEKEPDVKKLLTKNVLKLVIIYFVWSFLYGVDALGIPLAVSHPEKLFRATLESKYHMWFLVTMVGVYLLIPLFWCLVRYKNAKYLGYACALFLVFGILRQSLMLIPFENGDVIVFICVFGYQLAEYSGYFLLGYYLRSKKLKKNGISAPLALAIFAVSAALAAFIEYLIDAKNGYTVGRMYEKFVFTTFIGAVVIFALFCRIKIRPGRFANAVKGLSGCTLGIYLLHPFVLEMLDSKLGINTLTLHPAIAVPLLTAAVSAICFCVTFVLKKIPLVGKWLV